VYLERIVAIVNATSLLCPGNVAHEACVAAQCAAGLVSCVVLVNIEALGEQATDHMQQRLRAINTHAPIINAVAGA
jgi:G3E family GTPase